MEVQAEESISCCVRHSTSTNTVAVEVPEEIKLIWKQSVDKNTWLWGAQSSPGGGCTNFPMERLSQVLILNNGRIVKMQMCVNTLVIKNSANDLLKEARLTLVAAICKKQESHNLFTAPETHL